MKIEQADKVEFYGALVAYLRGNRATLESRTFAKDVLPPSHQDPFVKQCRARGLTHAFTKDLGLLKGKLRRQSVKFSSNVTLYAPPEVFRESVKIVSAALDGWTELKIRGTIEAIP